MGITSGGASSCDDGTTCDGSTTCDRKCGACSTNKHSGPCSTNKHSRPSCSAADKFCCCACAPTTVMAQPAYAAPPTTIQHVQPATTVMAPPTVMATPPATYAAPPADVGSAVVQAVPAHTGGAVYSVPG